MHKYLLLALLTPLSVLARRHSEDLYIRDYDSDMNLYDRDAEADFASEDSYDLIGRDVEDDIITHYARDEVQHLGRRAISKSMMCPHCRKSFWATCKWNIISFPCKNCSKLVKCDKGTLVAATEADGKTKNVLNAKCQKPGCDGNVHFDWADDKWQSTGPSTCSKCKTEFKMKSATEIATSNIPKIEEPKPLTPKQRSKSFNLRRDLDADFEDLVERDFDMDDLYD